MRAGRPGPTPMGRSCLSCSARCAVRALWRAFCSARKHRQGGVATGSDARSRRNRTTVEETMNAPAYNTVAWFQVGTTDAEQAKRFYGDLFGWRYTPDPNSEGKYHLVSYPGADTPSGGIFDTGGEFPNHAIFMEVVQEVAAVCAQVEQVGEDQPVLAGAA